MSKEPSAAQRMIVDIAPKLADLTDSVLFGDVWERLELSKRDRSLATVAALLPLNRSSGVSLACESHNRTSRNCYTRPVFGLRIRA
jgi:alkylhydroperoxidase/carboxymuconolactone decarboxylase family protein YurZ